MPRCTTFRMPIRRGLRRMTWVAAMAGAALAFNVAAASVAAPTSAQQCQTATGCEAKFCSIQAQLTQAEAAGNTRRADGLRRALAQARASCTPQSLQADYAREVAEKEEEVREREQDLREARQDGRARKIDRAEKKLREAREALDQARADKP